MCVLCLIQTIVYGSVCESVLCMCVRMSVVSGRVVCCACVCVVFDT